jgi:hypothetical protein
VLHSIDRNEIVEWMAQAYFIHDQVDVWNLMICEEDWFSV